jgi:hypothetical protein
MTSNNMPKADTAELATFPVLSEQEKNSIKTLIQQNLQKNDLKNSMSV